MKRLFLTSIACNVLSKFVDIYEIPDPQKLKVGFIPNASDFEQDAWWIKDDRDKLAQIGFNVRDIDLMSNDINKVKKMLKNSDIIFVAGGNTFYLLYTIIKSETFDLITELVNNGVFYIGSSAGSIIAGPNISPCEFLDDIENIPRLSNYNSLNLVNITVLPHFGVEEYEESYKKLFNKYYSADKNFVTLNDNQGIIIEDNKFELITV